MWNYRIVRRRIPIQESGNTRDKTFGIHEAYYDKNGKVWAITEEQMCPVGDSRRDLEMCFEQMRQAFKRPVLKFEDIPEHGAIEPSLSE